MPSFAYKGTAGGKSTTGTIEAADQRGALRKLRASGINVFEVKAKGGSRRSAAKAESPRGADNAKAFTPAASPAKGTAARKLFAKKPGPHLALPLFRKLLQLHSSGMPMGDALHLMSNRMTDPALKELTEGLYRDLSEGRTLATAMRQRGEVFTPTQSHLIEAGEATGNLQPILENIIENLEATRELQKKISSAMAYPILLISFAMGVIAIFLFYLLPKIEMLMAQLQGELNIAAKLMIGASDFALTKGPFVLGALFVAALVIVRWRETENGKLTTDGWLLSLPLVKDLTYNSEIARVSNVMAILLGNGVNTTESLRLAGGVLRNAVLAQKFQAARALINDGAPYSTAIQRYGLMPEMDVDILGIGESTGSLVNSFREIYRTHAEELTAKLKVTTNLIAGGALGFAFILVGVLVAGIVLSILNMSESILAR